MNNSARIMESYSRSLELSAKSDNIFNALTTGITSWWTEMFNGSAYRTGDIFTVRFGDDVHKTIRVAEMAVNSKIVWYVEDSRIALPGLQNQREWIGTTIEWNIIQHKSTTQLLLTHAGLHPGIECYDMCQSGWQQFTDSLKLYAETGTGNPYKNSEAGESLL